MESGDVDLIGVVFGKEVDVSEWKVFVGENLIKVDVVDSCFKGIGWWVEKMGVFDIFIYGVGCVGWW